MSKLRILPCVCIAAASLMAQFDSAEVLGTVRDPSGRGVPNAAVTLINQQTGIRMKTATGDNGNYDFFNVRNGRYTIKAELPGFSKYTTRNVTVNVDSRQSADITMNLGQLTETETST